ncbi:MAG: PEFG-CTERM sorting domain-containing protein, partial [Nitrosopumilaceae archaeon]|nr:PEFG-CTERM sorting domain-containing protein [Nitrosopumilaceae archaeon]
QFPYQETETNNQLRLITINFEEGTSIIEVIGTFVIPEFGSMVMVILLIGIVSVIGITKNKFQIKI